MNFVLLVGLKLKKYHFCEEISDLKQGETTFQNTLKIETLARVPIQLDTLHSPT